MPEAKYMELLFPFYMPPTLHVCPQFFWAIVRLRANQSTVINNATLGYIIKDYFLSFATNLDPNARSFSGTSKPFWPQYTAGVSNVTFAVMDVNYTMMGVTEDFDASPQCDFFHGQSYVVRN